MAAAPAAAAVAASKFIDFNPLVQQVYAADISVAQADSDEASPKLGSASPSFRQGRAQ